MFCRQKIAQGCIYFTKGSRLMTRLETKTLFRKINFIKGQGQSVLLFSWHDLLTPIQIFITSM